MEWTPPSEGIVTYQGDGVVTATTKEKVSMEQISTIGIDLAELSVARCVLGRVGVIP